MPATASSLQTFGVRTSPALTASIQTAHSVPIHGFVLDGWLYLDPAGSICYSLAGLDAAADAPATTGSAAAEGSGDSWACNVGGQVTAGSLSALPQLRADARSAGRRMLSGGADIALTRHALMPARPAVTAATGGADAGRTLQQEQGRTLSKVESKYNTGTRRALALRLAYATASDGTASVPVDRAAFEALVANLTRVADLSFGATTVEARFGVYAGGGLGSACVYTLDMTAQAVQASGDVVGSVRAAVGRAMAAESVGGGCLVPLGDNDWEHVLMFVPQDDVLPFLGIANLPGANLVLNGLGGTLPAEQWSTLIHEMGHTWGLSHANAVRPDTLERVEYGDGTDTMGSEIFEAVPGALDFSSAYKHGINWLPDTRVADVTTAQAAPYGATLTLSSIDRSDLRAADFTADAVAAAPFYLGARLPDVRGVPNTWLYASYRAHSPSGGDALYLTEATQNWDGYSLYDTDTGVTQASINAVGASTLFDATPFSADQLDADVDPQLRSVVYEWERDAPVAAAAAASGVVAAGNKWLVELKLSTPQQLAGGSAAVAARVTPLTAAGERLAGRGCTSNGCQPSSVAISTVACGASLTVNLTVLAPVTPFRITFPSDSAAYMVNVAATPSAPAPGVVSLGLYKGYPTAQTLYGSDMAVRATSFSNSTLYVNSSGLWAAHAYGTLSLPLSAAHDAYLAVHVAGLSSAAAPWAVATVTVSCAASAACDASAAIFVDSFQGASRTVYTPEAARPVTASGRVAYAAVTLGTGPAKRSFTYTPASLYDGSTPGWELVKTTFTRGSVSVRLFESAAVSALDVTEAVVSCACPAGSYAGGAGTCVPCGPGMVSPPGSTAATSCTCDRGMGGVRTGGVVTSCAICAASTYKSTVGTGACAACPAGTVGPRGSNTFAACRYPSYDSVALSAGSGEGAVTGTFTRLPELYKARPQYSGALNGAPYYLWHNPSDPAWYITALAPPTTGAFEWSGKLDGAAALHTFTAFTWGAGNPRNDLTVTGSCSAAGATFNSATAQCETAAGVAVSAVNAAQAAWTTATASGCAEGFYKATPGGACSPCAEAFVASDAAGTACACPAAYAGAAALSTGQANTLDATCTPPTALAVSVPSDSAAHRSIGGSYFAVGTRLASAVAGAAASTPIYARDAASAAAAGTSASVYLSYVAERREWSFSPSADAPLTPRYAYIPAASMAVPVAAALPAAAGEVRAGLVFSAETQDFAAAGIVVEYLPPSPSPTPSATASASHSASGSATPIESATSSGSSSASVTSSGSPSVAASGTASSSVTPSGTGTMSTTPSETLSGSITPSETATSSITGSETASLSTTPSITASETLSGSITPSETASSSITPSETATSSITGSETASGTSSPSRSASATVSGSVSASATASGSVTPSVTASGSVTSSVTASGSVSPSTSASRTASASVSPSASVTASVSGSATQTPSVSRTPPLIPPASALPSVEPAQAALYREVRFNVSVQGANLTVARNSGVLLALRTAVAARAGVSLEFVQVEELADGQSGARLRLLGALSAGGGAWASPHTNRAGASAAPAGSGAAGSGRERAPLPRLGDVAILMEEAPLIATAVASDSAAAQRSPHAEAGGAPGAPVAAGGRRLAGSGSVTYTIVVRTTPATVSSEQVVTAVTALRAADLATVAVAMSTVSGEPPASYGVAVQASSVVVTQMTTGAQMTPALAAADDSFIKGPWMIVVCVIGGVVVLAVAGLCIYRCCCYKRRSGAAAGAKAIGPPPSPGTPALVPPSAASATFPFYSPAAGAPGGALAGSAVIVPPGSGLVVGAVTGLDYYRNPKAITWV